MMLYVYFSFCLFSVIVHPPVGQTAQAQGKKSKELVAPTVFQAAGPMADSIKGTVDAFRAALGDPNNANNPGPLTGGRREINWDGGVPPVDTTTAPVTPFNVFLATRGGQFTNRGWFLRLPGGGARALSAFGCSTLHHLQRLRRAPVHRQQHHRSFVLRTRRQSQSAARHQSGVPSNGPWLRRGVHRC